MIELLNPVYDAAAGTLTYDARVLADYAGEGLKGAGRQQADYEFPEQFGEGGLFIDSCPDGAGTCSKIVNGQKHDIGPIQDVGYCWSLKLPDVNYDCYPCNNDGKSWYYGHLCAKNFPDHCSYTCNATGCSWDCYVFDVNTSDF